MKEYEDVKADGSEAFGAAEPSIVTPAAAH
jgi:hypothetical protein